MSLAQAPPSDSAASPLMSNNPFRNRIATNPPAQSQSRPISTNPFLDVNEIQKEQPQPRSPSTAKAVPTNGSGDASDIFASLSIKDNPSLPPRPQASRPDGVPRRPENSSTRPPHGHRSTLSGEARRLQNPDNATSELDIFADPIEPRLRPKDADRVVRRNSESSVVDKPGSLNGDDERLRRERRFRESKRPGTTRTKPTSKKLDVIDKLDVTSIYGTGLFHHDGPFDACNPHRNRRKHKLAPMQAFPKDSENMKIGGSGPVNDKLDYNKFHGFGQEAHIDFNEAGQGEGVVDDDAAYFNRQAADKGQILSATARVDQVHGRETAGLGTSTFLEGAPASRAAIQRRDSEYEQQLQGQASGLSRKKSFAQKIRAVRPGGAGRVQSPDSERPPQSPLYTGRNDISVNSNPFFPPQDTEGERKGAQIIFTEEQAKATRTRAPSSPRRGAALERSITAGSADVSAPESKPESKPTGLLGRMKSLKKSRK